jgi:hypothetical protein
MQLRSYLHQALIRMLPAPGEPVLQKDFQLRDLVLPPLGARSRAHRNSEISADALHGMYSACVVTFPYISAGRASRAPFGQFS